MPLHDWTKTDAGTFHALHTAWIANLQDLLNQGVLPAQYFALAEQKASEFGPDVLALERGSDERPMHEPQDGGIAIQEAPPSVSYELRATEEAEPLIYARKANRLAIRHRSGRELIAIIELLSPGNKHSESRVDEFVTKAFSFVNQGVHMVVVDCFPPSRFDPHGIHSRIWEELTGQVDPHDPGAARLFSSYDAAFPPTAYVEQQAIGQPLKDMPLFLKRDTYVEAPLNDSYERAVSSMPKFLIEELEANAS